MNHSDAAADRGFVLSHWPSSPDRTCDAPAGVVERGHAVAIGACRSGHAPGAVMEGGDAVAVGSRAAGHAAGAIVEANVLRVGGRERGKRGQCEMMMRMVDLIVVRSRAMMRQIMLPAPSPACRCSSLGRPRSGRA
jgi:hypothetical protein